MVPRVRLRSFRQQGDRLQPRDASAKPTQLSQTDIATNRLTTATYDAAGSMTSHPVLTPGGTITYDANNKKKTFTKTGLSVTTYYDANDRRVCEAKVKGAATNTTIWAYNAFGALVDEYSTDTPTVADGVYYRTTDHLGSTRVVTDDTDRCANAVTSSPSARKSPATSTTATATPCSTAVCDVQRELVDQSAVYGDRARPRH